MEAVNGDTDKDTVAFNLEDNETECCVLTVTDHVAEMQVIALSLSGLGVHTSFRPMMNMAIFARVFSCPYFSCLSYVGVIMTDFNSCCPR